MATAVASNQLITPYMATQQGLKTDNTGGDAKNLSNIISKSQSLAYSAWGSSTNYDTRIMTRADMVNSGIWAAQEGTSGYSNNQCVPYGVLHDYQMNNQWVYSTATKLNWGSAYLNTGYSNWGYVDVYLYSPYYYLKTWTTTRSDTELNILIWNGSDTVGGYAGTFNAYVRQEGSTLYTLADYTKERTGYHPSLDWDGKWVHLLSLPWFDNSGVSASNSYLSLVSLNETFDFYGVDNYYVTPSKLQKNNVLSDKRGNYDVYTMHDPIRLYGNGQSTKVYIE